MSETLSLSSELNFIDILEITESVINRRMAGITIPAVREKLLTLLLDGGYLVHPQLISSKTQLHNEVWSKIRKYEDDVVINFISLVSEFFLHLSSYVDDFSYDVFCNGVSGAISGNLTQDSAMDEVFCKQLASANEVKELFINNPWYLFLVILGLSKFKAVILVTGTTTK